MHKNPSIGLLALTVASLLPACESPKSGGAASMAPAVVGTDSIVTLSDASFAAEVLQSKQPVLVDFWAPWCGPCKRLAPTIQELARDYAGKVKVAKLNTDDNPGMVTRYEIEGIPCVLLFQDGKVVQRILGANPGSAYAELLDRHLKAR
jgi:thioredoxin 1